MRKPLLYFTLPVVVSAVFLFAVIGCERVKNEQVSEQKISQLQSFALPQKTDDLDFSLEKVEDKGGIIEVTGWAAIKNTDSVNALKFFVLQSENKTYIFDTLSLWKRPDVTQVYKMNRDDSGFNVFIPKNKIERGKYKAGIIIKKDKITSFQYFPGRNVTL
jgi:hypothetical protein